MGFVETTVEQLREDRVRLSVEVPRDDLRHAVDHAASDLARTVKVPGFRKGKVPLPVLVSRLGKERVLSEAVESHIGGWFVSAAEKARIRPVSRPEYEYELPESAEGPFRFTATVAVQPPVEVADWTQLEVPAAEVEVSEELIVAELDRLRRAVAQLAPVERAARQGDVVVVDLVSPSGEARRDVVVEVGAGRMVEELEEALVGMAPGDTKAVEHELADGSTATVEVTVKEVKEPVLPPLDDELAKAASEHDTLADLRADIERSLRSQLEEEAEAEFRAAAVDALVEASGVTPAPALVEARASDLKAGLVRSLERRGISLDTYLAVTGRTADELRDRLREQARRSLARELVLEAVADQLQLEVTDEELEAFLRRQAEEAGERDPEAFVERHAGGPGAESLREDLRLRKALDRVAAEVRRISPELAHARAKLWTPGKEKGPGDPKLWTPGQEERR